MPPMPQTKHEIQELLIAAGSNPRKQFGQNFMIDQNLVRLVADAGGPKAGDLVIEVGPGTGTLTEEIISRGADCLAVEIDRDLAQLLRDRFANEPRFALIEGDALAGKHELNPRLLEAIRGHERVKLIANLPYNIASPLIIELLIAGVELLAFTVQNEVARRLAAAANSDDYGPLTVMAQMLGDVEILRTLPPQAFWPQPKVESALVRIVRRDRLGAKANDFGRFVQKLFSSRRKTLRKAMTIAGYSPELLETAKIPSDARVETLAPERLLELFNLTK